MSHYNRLGMANSAYSHFSNKLNKGFHEVTGPRTFKAWLGNVVDTFYPNNDLLENLLQNNGSLIDLSEEAESLLNSNES